MSLTSTPLYFTASKKSCTTLELIIDEGHITNVHTPRPFFTCFVCNKSFSLRCNLNKHIRNVHSQSKRFCCKSDGCCKMFSSNCSLQRHILSSHHGFQCPKCEMRFPLPNILENHLTAHHPNVDKSSICKICGMNFVQEGALEQHMILYYLQIRYTCNHCTHTYKILTCMEQHMKLVHPNVRHDDYTEIKLEQ